MLKTVWFARFDEKADRNEARRRWTECCSALLGEQPGVVRAVQNLSLDPDQADARPGFDAFLAVWWSDRSTYKEAVTAPEWEAGLSRIDDALDREWMLGRSAEVNEHVMRVGLGASADGISTPKPGALKMVGLVGYLPQLARTEASEHWLHQHGELALAVDKIGHYVQNHAKRQTASTAAGTLRFDGYSEAWFVDADALDEALTSHAWSELAADSPNLFNRDVFLSAAVEERALR